MSLQIVITTEAHRGYFVSRYINLQVVITTSFSPYINFVFFIFLRCLVTATLFLVISTLFSRFSTLFSRFSTLFSRYINFVFSLYQICSFFLFSCYINLVFLLYQLRFFSIFSPFSQLRFLVIST